MLAPYVAGIFLSPDSSSKLRFRIAAEPGEVWRVLANAETSGANIEQLSTEGGKSTWVEDIGLARIRVRTLESEFETLLVRSLTDESIPMEAEWRVELAPEDGGTIVVATNQTHVGKGSWRAPLYRFLMHFLNGPRRALVHYFTRLARSLGKELSIETVE